MILRLLLAAASLSLSAPALAQLTPETLEDLVRAEDAVSGSLLPLPARGSRGIVEGLSVTYDRLEIGGFGLEDLRFIFSARGDGPYDVVLESYALSPDLAATMGSLGYGEALPRFAGVWDPKAKTYASYSLTANLAYQNDRSEQSGTLHLTAEAGKNGALTLLVEGFESLWPSGALNAGRLELQLAGVMGQDFDPYGLINTLVSLSENSTSANPFAILGLLNTYSEAIFSSNLNLTLALEEGMVDMGAGSMAEVAQLDLSFKKRGQGANGLQSLVLAQRAEGVRFEEDGAGFTLDALTSQQTLSLNDLMGLVPQALPLGLQISLIETPADAGPLARTIGQMIAGLDPKFATEINLQGLALIENPETLGSQYILSGNAEELGYRFVFDLKDQISFHVSSQESAFESKTRWSDTSFALGAGGLFVGVHLWDSFLTDFAAAIADSLELSGQIRRGTQPDKSTSQGLTTVSRLLGGVFYTGALWDLATAYNDETARTLSTYGNLTWNVSTEKQDDLAKFDFGFFLRDVLSLKEWDHSFERTEKFSPFSKAEIAAARQGEDQTHVTLMSEAMGLDTSIVLGDLAPLITELDKALQQAEQLLAGNPEAITALINPLIRAGFALFHGADMRLTTQGFLIPAAQGEPSWDNRAGVCIGAGALEVLLSDVVGYRGVLSDFALDMPDPLQGGDTRLKAARLDLTSPFAESYAEAIAELYGDLFSAAIAGKAPTWGQLLQAYAQDMDSLTSELAVEGLEVVIIPNELTLGLGEASLDLPGRLIAQPLSLEQALELTWSGLTAKAEQGQVQTYMEALLPEEGLLEVLATISLEDTARAQLDSLPIDTASLDRVMQLQTLAKVIAAFDYQLDLAALRLASSVLELEGEGSARPDIAAVPDGITSRRDHLSDGLDVTPNVKATFALAGLAAFEDIRSTMAKAEPATLGALDWLPSMAEALGRPLAWLQSYAEAGAEEPLRFVYRLTKPGDGTLNGRPLEF